MLRIVPPTVPRVGRSDEHFPDGFELHLLHPLADSSGGGAGAVLREAGQILGDQIEGFAAGCLRPHGTTHRQIAPFSSHPPVYCAPKRSAFLLWVDLRKIRFASKFWKTNVKVAFGLTVPPQSDTRVPRSLGVWGLGFGVWSLGCHHGAPSLCKPDFHPRSALQATQRQIPPVLS